MPIHNQPILPNRALGRQKKMLGFFPTYLVPGLLAGLTVMAVASELSKDKLRSAFLGSSVIAAYWLYAGRGEESAWTNFGRFLSVPVFHLPPESNQETLPPK